MSSIRCRSTNSDRGFDGIDDDAIENAHDRRQARRDPASVLLVHETDDSGGSRKSVGSAQVNALGGGARARHGLHGGNGTNAGGLGPAEEETTEVVRTFRSAHQRA